MFGMENGSLVEQLGAAPWYAVQTRSNFEKRVASELTYKGLETYCPVLEEAHQWTDRKKVVERPVFPGYVFVRLFDSAAERYSVVTSSGVVRILSTGKDLSPVPDREIESVRKLLASRLHCVPHPYLREGAMVRVCRGPLRDLEGILVKVKNQMRLVLSVTLLSRSVAAEVSFSDVEVIRMSGGSNSLVA